MNSSTNVYFESNKSGRFKILEKSVQRFLTHLFQYIHLRLSSRAGSDEDGFSTCRTGLDGTDK